jgi:hypothetical protein
MNPSVVVDCTSHIVFDYISIYSVWLTLNTNDNFSLLMCPLSNSDILSDLLIIVILPNNNKHIITNGV